MLNEMISFVEINKSVMFNNDKKSACGFLKRGFLKVGSKFDLYHLPENGTLKKCQEISR